MSGRPAVLSDAERARLAVLYHGGRSGGEDERKAYLDFLNGLLEDWRAGGATWDKDPLYGPAFRAYIAVRIGGGWDYVQDDVRRLVESTGDE